MHKSLIIVYKNIIKFLLENRIKARFLTLNPYPSFPTLLGKRFHDQLVPGVEGVMKKQTPLILSQRFLDFCSFAFKAHGQFPDNE